MKSWGTKMEDVTGRTQWKIEIKNYSSDHGKSLRSTHIKKPIPTSAIKHDDVKEW